MKNIIATIAVTLMIATALISCVQQTNVTPEVSEQPAEQAVTPTPESISTPASEPASEPAPEPLRLPQIDCSTARIPITSAIYELFTGKYGYAGPEPICSKTHGAWLNLADGKADIIFLVAPTKEELDYFTEKGVDFEMKIYGYDGLVFIGNESNKVNNLTSKQIRDIYSGKIKDWKKVGGVNSDIIVYIRDEQSGSQRLFESLVWDGYKMPDFSSMGFMEGEVNPTVTQRKAKIKVDDDMSTITKNVLLNQYSIGFNIMSYIDTEFSNSTLKLFSIDGYAPTTENFASGNYPFLTTSYVVIRADEPKDSPARQLYNWVGSEESYKLISENSTLSVSFSESVYIKVNNADPAKNTDLANMIEKLDKQNIGRQDLIRFTLAEIDYLRNGVYARSGKIFKTKEYAEYFSAQSWYIGVSKSEKEIVKKFNEYQNKNLETILNYEKELKRALPKQ